MRNIRFFLGLAVAIPMLAACQSNAYQVNGAAKDASDGAVIYLSTDFSSGMPADSTVVKDGKFTFQGQTDSTYLAIIYMAETPTSSASLFIEPGQNASIDLVEGVGKSRVSGTKVNDEWQALNDNLQKYQEQSMKLFDSVPEDPTPEQQADLMAEMKKVEEAALQEVIATAERNIDNELGFFILTNYIDMESLGTDKCRQLVDKLPAAMAKRPTIQALLNQIEKLQETEVGNTIKDFTLNTPDGEPLSVMDEVKKNKLTLLDFWASWCGPCRNDMPGVVALYKQYEEKGFGIVGISLDNDSEAWKNAIKELGITWPQMSDLKGWQNEAAQMFAVSAIPQTFLVDSEGKILAKGLRGKALEEFVAAQFGD